MMNEKWTVSRLSSLAGVIVVLLPVLFVLSSGPAYWAWINGLLLDDAFSLAYEPLFGLFDSIGIWRYVRWYFDLFDE